MNNEIQESKMNDNISFFFQYLNYIQDNADRIERIKELILKFLYHDSEKGLGSDRMQVLLWIMGRADKDWLKPFIRNSHDNVFFFQSGTLECEFNIVKRELFELARQIKKIRFNFIRKRNLKKKSKERLQQLSELAKILDSNPISIMFHFALKELILENKIQVKKIKCKEG